MLNLLRVELKKFRHSTAIWLTLLLFCVTLLATFIPLSFSDAGLQELYEASLSGVDQQEYAELIEELSGMVEDIQLHDNYFKGFYRTSNGAFIIISIAVTIALVADFRRGTLSNMLLSGAPRSQIFLAKLLMGILAALVLIGGLIVVNLFIGTVFYHTSLNSATVLYLCQVSLMELAMVVQYVAICTAATFFFQSAWSMLATTLVLTIIPAIPVSIVALTGSSTAARIFQCMPSFLAISVDQSFLSLEQSIARPELWDTGFLLTAFGVCIAVTVLSALFGVWALKRRDWN